MTLSDFTKSSLEIAVTDEKVTRNTIIRAALTKKWMQFSDDAFFILDLNRIIDIVRRWQRNLPRVGLHYAVKCDSSPLILRALAALGCGFDVATRSEIDRTLIHVVNPGRLVYSNTCKSVSNILHAAQHNVRLTVFDSADELLKLKTYHPTAQLMVRLRYNNPHVDAKGQMHGRFGVYEATAKSLIQKAWDLGLNVVGVAFHVGVGVNGEATAHIGAIEKAKELFEFAQNNVRPFSILDIGGGFRGDWSNARLTFEEFCHDLGSALDTHFPPASGVRLIAEPGQLIMTTAQSLFLPVIGVKTVKEEQRQPGYVLADGVYGACRPIDIFKPKLKMRVHPLDEPSFDVTEQPCQPSTLYGPTCSPEDIIAQDLALPTLSTGTWLEIQNMGSYAKELSSNFNGVPTASTVVCISEDDLHLLK
ncbi:ornithine decarboxylase-like [Paramacrobiotus metropolitanus]|uniref:ornithine decarboxylase-like n=1 Tax=Paramacrobiotus metropolitanus TaxID=2943436 RepID=UPI00244571D1|nr:ornithine decarboxylase-like [Paramacrobiotus metropolitanus]